MFDTALRKTKDKLLGPVVNLLAPVSPTALTAVGLAAGLACAGAAALGWTAAALGLWFLNRLLDGLDGLVARKFGKSSERGGYLDLVADFLVYAAVPLGLAWAAADDAVWAACAFLLGSFYVNAVSWLALSALEERHRSDGERLTTLAMPRGLMEGMETIVLYGACLLWTEGLVWLFSAGAVLVMVSAAQRVLWALRGGLR